MLMLLLEEMFLIIDVSTVSGNFVQGHVVLVGHVTKEGEDHEAGEEAGQRVDGAGDDSVPEQRSRPKIRTETNV